MLNIPLMSDNIDRSDIECLIAFLQESNRFTNGPKVREFEAAWSEWLGVKYSVFVNSGSSANFITLAAVREMYGEGEVIVSPLGWSSDISAIFAAGLKPVFVDVNLDNLALNADKVAEAITEKTRAVILTHVLGYDGMTEQIQELCTDKNIVFIEDVCESHGATHHGRKCGTFGNVSNFSFYYAHHMSTIEGGMVCTDEPAIYDMARMFRSHGMLRESDDPAYRGRIEKENPRLHPEFIFTVPGYNMRSTELNAVIGLNQLKRLDRSIALRRENYDLFIQNLDSKYFFTDFKHEGSSNYAFVLLPRKEYSVFHEKIVEKLTEENVEFRRGTAGGGNLARQPYVKKRMDAIDYEGLKTVDYIHDFGFYLGNYPALPAEKILGLCEVLNHIFY